MNNSFDFKGTTVESAKRNGLAELGLKEEEVIIEVIARGGIFSKAIVRITPKEVERQQESRATQEFLNIETREEDFPFVGQENSGSQQDFFDYDLYVDKQEEGTAFLKKLFELAGKKVVFESKVKTREEELCFYINGEDASSCIGYKGETLESIQVLVSHFINSGDTMHVNVIVDADFYREKRKKVLIALAKRTATQAFDQHKEIPLEPMNSFERRIVHQVLQNSFEATTRSEGEGNARHIVIVPKSGTMGYGTNPAFRKNGPSRIKSFGDKKRFF